MSSLYKQFDNIYSDIYRDVDTTNLPDKYLNTRKLYDRFMPRLKVIKDLNLTTGVDFGCGVGGTSVLGGLMGLDIHGIDIPHFDKNHSQGVVNPYSLVQKELKKRGYNMFNIDTSKFPWDDVLDDKYQFLLAFNSLDDDYSSNNSSNHVSFKRKFMINRMNEIYRIVKKDSVWLVGSTHKWKALLSSKFYKDKINSSEIDVRLWRK